MRALKSWTIGVAAACALALAAGCGGGGATGGSGGSAAGAQVVPASVALYAAIDSDLSSDQWTSVQKLLDKFPAKDLLLGKLQQSFESGSSVTWADVKAALGPEVDVAVLGTGGSATVVGLTQPRDTSKWNDLVRKTNAEAKTPGDRIAVSDYKGWKVFSDTQAKVDAFTSAADAGPALADDAGYQAASGKLADPALARVYASGAGIDTLVGGLGGTSGAETSGGKLDWLAADLVATADGVKLDGFTKTEGGPALPAPTRSKLLDDVPSGALVVAFFDARTLASGAMSDALNGVRSMPQAQPFVQALGRLGAVFGRDNVLYVAPGAILPEITLVTRPDSPAKARAAVGGLVRQLAGFFPVRPKPVTIGGVRAQELNLGRFSIFYGLVGGRLVVSDAQQAFSHVQAGGPKLVDDPTFKEAKDVSGLPDATNGFLYVNLKDAIPQVVSLAQLGGQSVPPLVADNLRPLRTLVAWGSADGGALSGELFLEVK